MQSNNRIYAQDASTTRITPSTPTPCEPARAADVVDEILRRETAEDATRRANQEAQERQRRQRDMRSAWTAFAGPRYSGCTFDSFETQHPEQEAAVAACRQYVDGIKGGATGGLI